MYKNIGKKIKGLAIFSFIVGALASIVLGISLIVLSDDSFVVDEEILIVAGIAVIVLGVLISWIASFVLYGYGELIQKTASIEETVNSRLAGKAENGANVKAKVEPTCINPKGAAKAQPSAVQPQSAPYPPYHIQSASRDNNEVKSNTADKPEETIEQPVKKTQVTEQTPIAPPVIESHPVSFFCSGCGNRLTVERVTLESSATSICPKCNSTINNAWVLNHFAE